VRCNALQCVCIVLQRVAWCCSVLQCAAVCCSVLQCVAEWCRVVQILHGLHLFAELLFVGVCKCECVEERKFARE